MATINKKKSIYNAKTFEDAPATIPNAVEQLKRTVMACMLWEDRFYESGEEVAKRIESLAAVVPEKDLKEIAIKAKYDQKIRHAPLLLGVAMARRGCLKADDLDKLIRRADELAEFVALYWKDGKCSLSKQVKLGLAKAFTKFDEYQLAKWNRDKEVKLRDVLFLCHAKPQNKGQADLWKRLIDGKLATPDTWEVEISASRDKRMSWARLIMEKRLGAQAFLMNLRNMLQAGITEEVLAQKMELFNYGKMLPFQFISAARAVPSLEPAIEKQMLKALAERPKIPGRTALLVDVSGSMDGNISAKGTLTGIETGGALAIIARELCENARVFTFSNDVVEVPARRGFALADAVDSSQCHNGTYLGKAIETIDKIGSDRIIVLTDEQSHDKVSIGKTRTYIINVAGYNREVTYGQNSVHVSGWSEKVIDYIMEYEGMREALSFAENTGGEISIPEEDE